MKKIFFVFLTIFCCIGMVACNSNSEGGTNSSTNNKPGNSNSENSSFIEDITNKKEVYLISKSNHYLRKSGSSDVYLYCVNEYEYDSHGEISMEGTYNYKEDGSLSSNRIYFYENEYNSKGKIIKSTTKREDNSIVSNHEYTYDANGDISEKNSYNANGELTSKTTYTHVYNEKGQLIEYTAYHDNVKNPEYNTLTWYKYGYDDAGNETYFVSYEMNGDTQFYELKEYNSSGQCIKKVTYDYISINNVEYMTYETYAYDSNGNLITIHQYYEDDDLCSKTERKYDQNNNLIEEISYNSDGSLGWGWPIEYEYIKQTIIIPD